MEKEWAGTTYGNGWMHKWLIRMLRFIDVRILYGFVSIFVIPVCLAINPSRGLIYRYLRKRQKKHYKGSMADLCQSLSVRASGR